MRRPTLPLLVSSVLLAGCIVEAPGRSQVKQRQTTRPPLEVRSGAILGCKLRLLGGRFQPGRIHPGEPLKVSLGFEVLAPIAQDHLVFFHLEGESGARGRVNADHVPRGGEYPTSRWQEGEVVRDDFTVTVPESLLGTQVSVWVGLWDPETDQRMPVSNAEAVQTDGQHRVLLARLPVED